MDIGIKIRKLRVEQRRTLQEIADASGFTKSFLSKIENGKAVPAVASLMKIADVLGVKASELMDEDGYTGTVYVPKNDSKMVKTEKGYLFTPIAAERTDKAMQPYLFIARKGEINDQKLSHEGEEFIYILEGELKYQVGNVEYHLKPGDSLYFNSLENHELTPITNEVRYLAVFTKNHG